MSDELRTHGFLEQETAVFEIERRFGDRFGYENENGNPAIDRKVLSAFRKITGGNAKWERGEKAWYPPRLAGGRSLLVSRAW